MSHQRLSVAFVLIAAVVLFSTTIIVNLPVLAVKSLEKSLTTTTQTLRFVDATGVTLRNRDLRLLCYASATATTPSADLFLNSDDQGQFPGTLPANCAHVAALQILHKQPSGKLGRGVAYTVYATSWLPGTRTLTPVGGDVVIDSQHKLVLFDVSITLEWQEASDRIHIQQLHAGLRQASAYLYDLSDGQIAFGAILIQDDGNGWDGADLRVRAANDYRPSALVGGMVATSTIYTTPSGITTVYQPGEILLSRHWDGNSAANPVSGNWAQAAGYRTIAHEWLHYALFLYDAYQDLDEDGRSETYCTCNELPQLAAGSGACGGLNSELAASAMAYHYLASELWLSGLPLSCVGTDQHKVHGETDWQTIEHWSAIQGLSQAWLRSPAQPVAGPDLGLVADLFDRTPTTISGQVYLPLISRSQTQAITQAAEPTRTDDTSATEMTIMLAIKDALLPVTALNQFQMQLYTLEPATGTLPARIVHQGASNFSRAAPNQLGSIQLLGVNANTKVHISASRVATSTESSSDLFYHGALPPASNPTILLAANSWPAKLRVTPIVSGTQLNTLAIELFSPTSLAVTPTVRICSPDQAIGCNSVWQSLFTLTSIHPSESHWSVQIRAADQRPLPHFGYVHVVAPGVGEMIRWFQTAGGVGPAHMFGEAPLRDGLLMVDSAQPLTGTPNLVFISPADTQTLIQSPLPPGSRGLVSLPLDVSVLLPTKEQGHASQLNRSNETTLPSPVVVTHFYDKAQFAQLGIGNNNAHLIYFDETRGQWLPAPAKAQSSTLGWITSPPQQQVGAFAVIEIPQPNFGNEAAMIADPGPIQPQSTIRAMVILPANPTLMTSAAGTISYTLAPGFEIAQPPVCNVGDCHFDAPTQRFIWAGEVNPNQPVVMIVTIKSSDPTLCQPTFFHNAIAFDGLQSISLTTTTSYACPLPTSIPTATPISTPISTTVTSTPSPTVSATLTPTGTPTPFGCQNTTRDRTRATTPTCTITPSPTVAATPVITATETVTQKL